MAERENYDGYYITIHIDPDGIGEVPEGVDFAESARKLCDLTMDALEKRFPGAEVDVEYGPTMKTVEVYCDHDDETDQCGYIATEAENVSAYVYRWEEWTVPEVTNT
jgi:hypothetical protein